MEILGMTIAQAAIAAAIAGVFAVNAVGWLTKPEEWNIRHTVASAIIAFITAVPSQVVAFQAVFQETESVPIEVQLMVFFIQLAAVAGFDKLAKGGFKAAKAGAFATTKSK